MKKTEYKNDQSRIVRSVLHSTKSSGIDPEAFVSDAERRENIFSRYDALVIEKREVESEISRLNQSVQRAKMMAYHKKKYVDPTTWKSWQDRLRVERDKAKSIEQELSELKAQKRKIHAADQERKRELDLSFDVVFRACAEEMLAGPVYQRILNAAMHRASESIKPDCK